MLTSAFLTFSEEERTRFQKLLASPTYRAEFLDRQDYTEKLCLKERKKKEAKKERKKGV